MRTIVISALAALLFFVACSNELRAPRHIEQSVSVEEEATAPPPEPPPAPRPPPPAAPPPMSDPPAAGLDRDRLTQMQVRERSSRESQIRRERKILSVPSIQEATEQVSQQLFKTSAAISGDTQGNIDDTLEIRLTLDPSLERQQLESKLREENPNATVVTVDTKISALAWPELIAPDFDVVPSVAAEQAVILEGPTDWLWRLKPKYGGEFTVIVDLYAVVYVGDQKTKRKYRTLRQEVTVVVPPVPWYVSAQVWINQRWEWLWSVILIPALSLIWSKIKKKKNR